MARRAAARHPTSPFSDPGARNPTPTPAPGTAPVGPRPALRRRRGTAPSVTGGRRRAAAGPKARPPPPHSAPGLATASPPAPPRYADRGPPGEGHRGPRLRRDPPRPALTIRDSCWTCPWGPRPEGRRARSGGGGGGGRSRPGTSRRRGGRSEDAGVQRLPPSPGARLGLPLRRRPARSAASALAPQPKMAARAQPGNGAASRRAALTWPGAGGGACRESESTQPPPTGAAGRPRLQAGDSLSRRPLRRRRRMRGGRPFFPRPRLLGAAAGAADWPGRSQLGVTSAGRRGSSDESPRGQERGGASAGGAGQGAPPRSAGAAGRPGRETAGRAGRRGRADPAGCGEGASPAVRCRAQLPSPPSRLGSKPHAPRGPAGV